LLSHRLVSSFDVACQALHQLFESIQPERSKISEKMRVSDTIEQWGEKENGARGTAENNTAAFSLLVVLVIIVLVLKLVLHGLQAATTAAAGANMRCRASSPLAEEWLRWALHERRRGGTGGMRRRRRRCVTAKPCAQSTNARSTWHQQ
jgi:hypothetical protein